MTGRLVEGPVDLDVFVIDQNDNRPVFRESRYTGEVLEGSPTGMDYLLLLRLQIVLSLSLSLACSLVRSLVSTVHDANCV